MENTNTQTVKWNALKGEIILASESSEKQAWKMLGAKTQKDRDFLKTLGFAVVQSS